MTRILIGALSGWKYHERRQRCLSTWMADADAVGVPSVFLLGCPAAAQPEAIGPHALACPCPDDYASLPQRTLWFCRWALQRADWDYLFKCDDDTYVSIPRLLAYDLAGRDYVGAEWQAGVGYGSGGAGYFLGRRAAGLVAQRLQQSTGSEDLLVGEILRAAGVAFSLEPRLVPFGSMERRPKKENDLITLHGVAADAFLAAHAEAGLQATAAGGGNPATVKKAGEIDERPGHPQQRSTPPGFATGKGMLVYGFHTHRHDFVARQTGLVRKFVAGVSEFAVACNEQDAEGVQAECRRLGIRFCRLADSRPVNPSFQSSDSMLQLWRSEALGRVETVLFLDLDLFPIRPTNPCSWLDSAHIAATACQSTNIGNEYFPFPGLLAIRADVPHRAELGFAPAHVRGCWCDSGAELANAVIEFGISWNRMPSRGFCDGDLPGHLQGRYEPAFGFSLHGGGCWLHTSKGTNWNKEPAEFVARKNALIYDYLDFLLQERQNPKNDVFSASLGHNPEIPP